MDLFANVGRTLALLRNLRGLSQASLARKAGVGKSQLSKYENGKELPKLDSLGKLLRVLGVGSIQFFFAMSMVDQCASSLEGQLRPEDSLELMGLLRPLSAPLDQAFSRVLSELLALYRTTFQQSLLGRMDGSEP